MATALRAVPFAFIAFAIGWYAWRGVMTGRIMIGIRGVGEFWFDRREDPFTFWTVISFVAFVMVLAAIIAIRAVFPD
jgi:hypothetical protein